LYIQLYPWDIPGHDALRGHLENEEIVWPDRNIIGRTDRITMTDMYVYGELNEYAEFQELWTGINFIPETTQPDADGDPVDALGYVNWYREYGPFDRESIMLYMTSPIPQKPMIMYKNPFMASGNQPIRESIDQVYSAFHCC